MVFERKIELNKKTYLLRVHTKFAMQTLKKKKESIKNKNNK